MCGYATQFDSFPRGMTGFQFVYSYLRLSGMSHDDCQRTTAFAIGRVNLGEAAHRKIAGYSKGMRQRIKLAQAIAHDPRVLVLDEPLNGLDPLVRAETIALFREFAAEGRHVIVSSHILHEVDTISDQVILLSNGYVVAEGQIRGVREEMSEHPMQVIIRCTRANVLASRVFEQDHVVEVRLTRGRRRIAGENPRCRPLLQRAESSRARRRRHRKRRARPMTTSIRCTNI